MPTRDEHPEHPTARDTAPSSAVAYPLVREHIEHTRLDGLLVPSPSALTARQWRARLEREAEVTE